MFHEFSLSYLLLQICTCARVGSTSGWTSCLSSFHKKNPFHFNGQFHGANLFLKTNNPCSSKNFRVCLRNQNIYRRIHKSQPSCLSPEPDDTGDTLKPDSYKMLFSSISLNIYSSHLPSDCSTKQILHNFSFSIRSTSHALQILPSFI